MATAASLDFTRTHGSCGLGVDGLGLWDPLARAGAPARGILRGPQRGRSKAVERSGWAGQPFRPRPGWLLPTDMRLARASPAAQNAVRIRARETINSGFLVGGGTRLEAWGLLPTPCLAKRLECVQLAPKAFGACWRFRVGRRAQKREQAPRTPHASRARPLMGLRVALP